MVRNPYLTPHSSVLSGKDLLAMQLCPSRIVTKPYCSNLPCPGSHVSNVDKIRSDEQSL